MRKNLILVLLMALASVVLISCGQRADKGPSPTLSNVYTGDIFSELNGTYGGVDDLGRELSLPGVAPALKQDRYVGIFYFLWQGQHGTVGPYDNSKIMADDPQAMLNEKKWGALGAHHFWGEPLFGYYISDDTWVMRKEIQMLTDAGVDYLMCDATNAFTYTAQTLKLMKILDEYQKEGWNVPKISFYTNSSSGKTMTELYTKIYKAHPEYESLWFKWEGKPLVIGLPADKGLSAEAKEFFRIKTSQWPNEYDDQNKFIHHEDGFPWISFERPQFVFKNSSGENEVISVAVAQHPHIRFSSSAFYNKALVGSDINFTRSYHDGANDTSEGAVNYGYNFKEQWEFAIKQDPKMIFITGWNEWVAQRQKGDAAEPIVFIDCADINNSRDTEPMKGGYGDNYYLQLMNYIRLYKGTAAPVYAKDKLTVDINGEFTQWNDVKAVYKDYSNDIVARNFKGFGTNKYVNNTGRNDFDTMKLTSDDTNVYFYVKTVADMTPSSDVRWMNLFIKTDNKDNPNWYGYDYVINRVSPSSNEAVIEKSNGGWSWQEVGKVSYKAVENEMQIAIPRELLGVNNKNINIQFKWADNYQGEGDVFSFYSDGDVAPYGRLNYVYAQ